jgi:transcriptional regulator with XRE-family HTH domain
MCMAKQRVRPIPKLRKWRRTFVKEWREYRGLTQEQLAERVGMSKSNISQLEQARQGYSAEGLEKLADALRCEPAHLLMVDPTKDDAMWAIWERAKEGERKMIIELAKTVVKTGT